MTAEQIEICKALGTVTYLPASWDKRLGKTLYYSAISELKIELTEKQNEWMFRLLYKYRKQLPVLYKKHKSNPLCSQLKTAK